MKNTRALQALTDDELLHRLSDLLGQSRRVEADLVAHIGEVDERRLYAREAAPSMFVYCTMRLGLSEAEAYLRIEAARAVRRYPKVLEMLREGRLHLSAIAKLAPHLTPDNCDGLLQRAAGQSKRRVEELVAELAPRPDVAARVRKLPDRPTVAAADSHLRPTAPAVPPPQLRPDGVPPAPIPPSPRPPVVEPLAPARYKIQFTANAALRGKLERLCALMRDMEEGGDLAAVIEAAVNEKLERLEARRFALTSRPRKQLEDADTSPSSRSIPAPVRRAVFERDGGQCYYVDASGRRCPERHRLEYHHHDPFGRGGDHSVANCHLACSIHNLLLAEEAYGKDRMAPYRRAARESAT
jgi:hypothetical protein